MKKIKISKNNVLNLIYFSNFLKKLLPRKNLQYFNKKKIRNIILLNLGSI